MLLWHTQSRSAHLPPGLENRLFNISFSMTLNISFRLLQIKTQCLFESPLIFKVFVFLSSYSGYNRKTFVVWGFFLLLFSFKQEICAKDAEVVLCGGTENMSQAPYCVRNMRFGTRLGVDIKVWNIKFLKLSFASCISDFNSVLLGGRKKLILNPVLSMRYCQDFYDLYFIGYLKTC